MEEFLVDDKTTIHALYRKLLNLYPRGFREQLGESMQQTFSDLYTQRKQQTNHGLFTLVLWIFVETAIGIVQEHLYLFIAHHLHMRWPVHGRNLLPERDSLRLIVALKVNCLEQTSGQLCFNKRHEKTSHRMSPLHHCLPTCDANAYSSALPNRHTPCLAYVNPCYQYPCTNSHA